MGLSSVSATSIYHHSNPTGCTITTEPDDLGACLQWADVQMTEKECTMPLLEEKELCAYYVTSICVARESSTNNRIYMDANLELREKLSKRTYKIAPQNLMILRSLLRICSGCAKIWYQYQSDEEDLIPNGYEVVDKRLVPVDFPAFKFVLRESQQAVYDELDDSSIINAWVSWGKTFTGLAIAGKLGQKTLVITHTVPLRNQWAKEVEKVYGIAPGIIGSGNFDTDSCIVVGNTQTLYRNIDRIRKMFGTIILDEMHHVSSPTFSKIIDSSHARYKIGLSGTIERKDGKHVVFRDYFGNKLFQPPKENFMTPKVNIYRSEVRFMDGANIPWANRVNNLANNEEYVHSISLLASYYAARGIRYW